MLIGESIWSEHMGWTCCRPESGGPQRRPTTHAPCKSEGAVLESLDLVALALGLLIAAQPLPEDESCFLHIQVPSRVRRGPVQIRHVLCFTAFRTHPGPEVGAIPARPGPILVPSVPSGSGLDGPKQTSWPLPKEECGF